MNAKSEHAPSSVSEFAAGTLALAAVALITFVGVTSSPQLETPSASPNESGRSSNGAGAPQKRKLFTRRSPPPEQDRPVLAPALRTTDMTGPMVPAAGVLDVGTDDPTRGDSTSRPEPPRPRKAAIPSPAVPERDPLSRADALAIQGKLHDLGYYPGEGDGVWGAASRNALRDYKSLNGLQHDDRWDRETEERLWSSRSIPATSTFIGGWAARAAECRQRSANDQVITINSVGAEANGAKCDFRSLRQEGPNRWRARELRRRRTFVERQYQPDVERLQSALVERAGQRHVSALPEVVTSPCPRLLRELMLHSAAHRAGRA
jgi:hypothetical protein